MQSLFVYLNAGTGIPCAGQVRAMPDPSSFLNANESKIEENFGLENPIGSKQNFTEKIFCIFRTLLWFYLNDGRGDA